MLAEFLDFIPPGAMQRIQMMKDQRAFRQDDPTRGIFLVESGRVDMRRITAAGHVVTLHRAQAGTLFAEASLFSDRYHCDAVCIRAGTILQIDKAHLLDRLASDIAFSIAFNRNLARQVQDYRQILELVAIRSARDRTFAALSLGYLTGTVTEMASRISLTQEACYRALRDLCDTGLVVQTGRGTYEVAKPGPRKKGPATRAGQR